MIITADEAKKLINGLDEWTDEKIVQKLKAIEVAVRSYTNNNFQNRSVRALCGVVSQKLYGEVVGLRVGNTVQISGSMFNNGLYVVKRIDGHMITVDAELMDEPEVLVTMIVYPEDIKDCAINLLDWEKENRSKVGIKSETLSRHSVTYFDMDSNNQVNGYPVSLMGCLKPYRKCRC